MTLGSSATKIVVIILVAVTMVVGAAATAYARQATPDASPIRQCNGALPDSRMVYLTGGQDEGAIVVAEADGTELDRFPIEGGGVARPTGYAGRVVVQTFGESNASTFYVVDAVNVTVTPIAMPSRFDDGLYLFAPWFVQSQGARWQVVSDLRGEQAALIDVQTGAVTDLSPLAAGEEVQWGAVTADDRYVAILANGRLRIAPVERLDQPRKAGGGASVANVSLSPDGRSLLYTTSGEGLSRLVREDVASAETVVVASSVIPPLNGRFLDSADRIVVQRGSIISVKDLAAGEERIVHRDVPPIAYAWPLGIGSRLVVEFASDDGETWALVDLDDGTVHRYDTSWARGEIVVIVALTPDGRYALFLDRSDEGSRLWRVDVEAAAAEQVASGTEVAGSFSPDGCWMVLTSTAEGGSEFAARTEIVSIGSDEPAVTIDGYAVVWVDV